jgi:chromosome partitioning protein
MSAVTIAICNFKGGVGKTVLAVNLATALANRLQSEGRRVLLLDLDPQASASMYMLQDRHWRSLVYPHSNRSLYGVISRNLHGACLPIVDADLLGGSDGSLFQGNGRQPTFPNLFLLPSHHDLDQIEDQLAARITSGIALAGVPRIIAPYALLYTLASEILESFDYIVLDCPPNHNHLVQNALYMADNVLVPVIPDWLSSNGLAHLIGTIAENFQRFEQKQKSVRAILPTLWDNRLSVFNDHRNRIATSLYDYWKVDPRLKPLLKGCELWDGLRRSGPVANLVEAYRPIVDLGPGDVARSSTVSGAA